MKVFKGIMNLFPKKMKVASGLSNHAEEDIKFLSMLSSSDTRELCASNGKYYYYFFMTNDNYIDIAKFVFARNGFNAEIHNTKYYYTGRQPVLRILKRDYANRKDLTGFIKSISTSYVGDMNKLDMQILNIRDQMEKQR